MTQTCLWDCGLYETPCTCEYLMWKNVGMVSNLDSLNLRPFAKFYFKFSELVLLFRLDIIISILWFNQFQTPDVVQQNPSWNRLGFGVPTEIPGSLCTLSRGWRPGRAATPSKPLLQLICRISLFRWRLNSDGLHSLSQEFQHYIIVFDFSTHIPHSKKCKFSPRIRTWKLRDPATASQFQSAFKVKTMTAAAAVAIALGTDAHTANRVESAWSNLKGPLLDAAT